MKSTVLELYPGIEQSDIYKVYLRCFKERVTIQVENEFKFPDNSVGWFDLIFQPVPEGIFIRSIDITERKRAELAVRDSEARYHTLFDYAPDGIIIADPQSYYLDANASMCRMLGYTLNELIGLHASDIVTPDEIQNIGQALRVLQTRAEYQREWQFQRKDGSTFPADVIATQMPDGNLLAVIRDIGERKLAEEQIRQSEERYRTLFDTLTEGFCTIEMIFDDHGKPADYRFLEINPAFEKQTGLHNAQGKLMRDLAPDHEAHWFEMYGHIALTGEPAQFENEAKALGRHYAVCAYRVGGPDSRKVGILFNDITERKRNEREILTLNASLEKRVQERTEDLAAANHELEAFSYSVSHDLRAPLRHINGFVELLVKNSGELNEANKRYLGIISRAAKQMGMLIDDLLSFARTGRTEVKRVSVPLDELIRNVIRELADELAGRMITWDIHPLPRVEADQPMLNVVFTNLISNAVKYTRTRENVVIEIGSLESTDGTFTLYIRDNGVGFDMTYADKLFGVFQRLHRADQFEGTGIGLATVRRIIHKHGGKTWAESKLNEGSVFYISLPKK